MIKDYKNIYFIGIGGIGMSAIALYLHKTGYKVSGYDLVRNQNCKKLESFGIKIHYEDNIALIPKSFLDNNQTLIIYTPAIPDNHKEYKHFKSNKFKILKRAQALGLISKTKKSVCVAGTHGKTSVSTLVAWIMHNSNQKCNAFLGGISKNLDTNQILNDNSEYVVLEADEFDRSFLNLYPFINLITCIEADHLDIYNNYQNLENAFIEYINRTDKNGKLILNTQVYELIKEKITTKSKLYTYSLTDSNADFYFSNIKYKNGFCLVDLTTPSGKISEIKVNTGGDHNLENTIAACAISIFANVNNDEIKSAINSYTGVKRRFDIQIASEKVVYIDDYAHHPGEIDACLDAIKKVYSQKKVSVIFQPHLYSRTRDFAEGFAKSLSKADTLYLLPIYPAREKTIPGVSSNMIFNLCTNHNKTLCKKNELLNLIKNDKPELLVTMGAGDIDSFVEPIKEVLKKQ